MPAIAHDKVVDRCQYRGQAPSTHGRQTHDSEGDVENGAQESAVFQQQVERAGVAEQYAGKVGVVELGEHRRYGHQQHDQDEYGCQLVHKAVAAGRQLCAQRYWWFAHQQAGHQRRDHQQAKEDVGTGPGRVFVIETGGAEAFGKEQGACGGQQGSNPIAGHVAGGQCSLVGVVDDFQAVGVDGNVLGGRGKGHHHGNRDQPGQVFLRVAEAHADQAEDHQDLRQHQPGSSSAQFAQQRQAPLVEQWRPDPFEGIGQPDQARVANGFAGHAGLTQPDGKRRKHKHVGQAGGEAKQQQHECRGAGISGERGAPGFTGHGLESASRNTETKRAL
ncbi:hypothetical protein D3C84_447900 [compost metagenome]